MVKVFRARTRSSVLAAIALLLLAIAPNAYAGGRKEDPLSKADQLIASRLYNEAIVELTSFIKQNPNRFDDAQKRLQRIIRLRETYNQTADELLDVMVNDPLNDERKLALIKRLEDLEAAPNRAAREFLSRTKETALFTYNRSKFEQIMGEGRALLDRNAYAAAARKYTEGFVLYKEEFDAASYGPLIVSRVDEGLRTINAQVARFPALVERLEAGATAFEKTFAAANGREGLSPATEAIRALESVMFEFAAARNAVTAAGRGFETQFLLLQSADKSLTDSSFLPFAFRFVLGRKTEVRPEGIMGAMDTLWIALANRVQAVSAAAADRSYAASMALRAAGDASARESFLSTAEYADLAMRTSGLWAAVAGAEMSPALTSYGRSIIAGKPQSALRYRSLSRLAKHEAAAESLTQDFGRLAARAAETAKPYEAGAAPAAAVVSAIRADRADLLELAGRVAGQIDLVGTYSSLVSEYAAQKLLGSEAVSYAAEAQRKLSVLSGAVFATDTDSAAAQYRIELAEIGLSRDSAKTDMARGKDLQSGTASADGRSVLKYPAESIPVYAGADEKLAGIEAASAGLLKEIGAENSRVSGDARLREIAAGARALQGEAAALKSETRAALAAARQRVQEAESARLEGERRYAEARSALARQNFDMARERLQRAGERFDYSLSIQESASLRADRDRRLLALSAEITKTENEVVVRDVRRLITVGREAYFAGSFDRAEDTLLQAQNRWKTTNVNDEPEVAYWLTLVRSALSIKTGRTIPVTAPLYAEMSRLLSFARQYYEEGKALLDARRKTDALAKFEDAKKKIQEVKIVFPINQEASLLSLRIEQVTDPDAFNASFRKKISDAQAKVKARPQEAYSELQDLAEINPRFPGLRTLIEKVEIDLGMRLPPPDRAALARSAQLTAAARRIVDANLRGQFPVALEQLNEALKLNPSNEQAVALKDRIQVDVGGQAAVVLTNTAEREYQRAVQELQKGNTIVALAIVEQLLRDPQNKNSPRILELQRRIQARL